MRLRDEWKIARIPVDKIEREEAPYSDELLESLYQSNQKYPITVTPNGDDGFLLINGRRRLNAIIANGGKDVLAWIKPNVDGQELATMALIGNAGTPNEMDECRHIMTLLDYHTQEQIAEMIGVSPATISQRLKLNKLIPEYQYLLSLGKNRGGINFTTALELCKLLAKKQKEIFDGDEKVSYKIAHKEVIEANSEQLSLPEFDVVDKLKPGLFLMAEQVEEMLKGINIVVKWNEMTLFIQAQKTKQNG